MIPVMGSSTEESPPGGSSHQARHPSVSLDCYDDFNLEGRSPWVGFEVQKTRRMGGGGGWGAVVLCLGNSDFRSSAGKRPMPHMGGCGTGPHLGPTHKVHRCLLSTIDFACSQGLNLSHTRHL